ncbi:MAG: ATP-binding protein [Candidatus Eremiobacteraeota bacterium]|nr:ATP-binding protein [Candidatus Eremiobacteraeota bacterium]
MTQELRQFGLEIPARPEFIRIARLIMAGLGNALCFNVEEIEDLKLAVGEACYQAFDSGLSSTSRLNIRSFLNGDGVEVEVTLSRVGEDGLGRLPGLGPGERRLGLTLLRHLVDELGFSYNAQSTEIRLLKRRLLN